MPRLRKVGHTKASGEEDQYRIPTKLGSDEGDEVYDADDEDQKLLIDVPDVERHQAAHDNRTKKDRNDDVLEQEGRDASFDGAHPNLLSEDGLRHRERHDDDHVLENDDRQDVPRHRARGPRLHDHGDRRGRRGRQRHRCDHRAHRQRSGHR